MEIEWESEIEWKSGKRSPYLFRQIAGWTGLKMHRARVMPGRMLEHKPDHHEINVTARRIRAFRHRSKDESGLDFVGVGLKRFSNRLCQTHCLRNEALQFLENGRLMVGPVMFLVADAFDGHETAALQAR